MIHVAVSVQRSFFLPADLAATSAYLRDFSRVLGYLPHLRLVKTFAANQCRILFSANEAGVYRLAFYCDLQIHYDETSRTLFVTPLAGIPPVRAKITFNSLTGQAYYSSTSVLHSFGKETRVDYGVEIKAAMPKRLEWKWVPDRIIERVAENRTRQQLSDMTDQFIARTIEEFRLPHTGQPEG